MKFNIIIPWLASASVLLAADTNKISAVAETSTNQPLAGVICISESRTNPPERLWVAEIDLTNPKLHLRVAPGGLDPDGDGRPT